MAQKVVLPSYSRGEERFNWITHCVGAGLSICGLIVAIVFAAIYNDIRCVISVIVYGVSMIVLYTMSTIYHALHPNRAKKLFRIFDHCSIFLLIAGTYTPYTMVTLQQDAWIGWTIFAIVWTAAIVGIVLNCIDIKRFSKISMVCYLTMGWCIIGAIVPLVRNLPVGGFVLLLLGGVSYTVGAVFYGFGHKAKYIHSVWHLFVLLGSILQFFSVLFFVIL